MADYVIDASGQKVGRLASHVAKILQGKLHASYEPHISGSDRVVVKNILKIVVSGRKAEKKIYYRHTGYMGHLREKSYKQVFSTAPEKTFYWAVFNMLPKNFLRQKRLNRLTIER